MTQGFNKHRRPTKRVGYFAHRSRLLFFHKEKVTSLNNVVNKIYIVKSEWNVIVTCCPKGLLVLRYALVNFSEFYAEFVYVQKQVI